MDEQFCSLLDSSCAHPDGRSARPAGRRPRTSRRARVAGLRPCRRTPPGGARGLRRTDHPRRGVDDDGQAGPDLRPARTAPQASRRGHARAGHLRRDDHAGRPCRGRCRRSGDHRRPGHHRTAQRVRQAGRLVRGRPGLRRSRPAGARGVHPGALGRGGGTGRGGPCPRRQR